MINWKYLDAEVYAEYNNLLNVVASISWVCELVDNGNVVSLNGKTGLDTENIDENYILLENITYEIADGWVKNKLGQENVLKIEESLSERLSDIINPKMTKVVFNFDQETIVSESVVNDTSTDDPNYSDRELTALGIGTT